MKHLILAAASLILTTATVRAEFNAGAAVIDVTPVKLPVFVLVADCIVISRAHIRLNQFHPVYPCDQSWQQHHVPYRPQTRARTVQLINPVSSPPILYGTHVEVRLMTRMRRYPTPSKSPRASG